MNNFISVIRPGARVRILNPNKPKERLLGDIVEVSIRPGQHVSYETGWFNEVQGSYEQMLLQPPLVEPVDANDWMTLRFKMPAAVTRDGGESCPT